MLSADARGEAAALESGLSHAILRPAVLFGEQHILVNNIAWALRRLPVFGVSGDGSYRLQPIHVDDLAALAAVEGGRRVDALINAIGPETFTYRDLVRRLGEIVGKRGPIITVSPRFAHAVGWLIGKLLGDAMVTWEEVGGLVADLLCVDTPPAGATKLADWARGNPSTLGVHSANDLAWRRTTGGQT